MNEALVTLRDVTAGLLIAAGFVSSWNAVSFHGIQPVDIFIALAVALSTIYLVGGTMPWVPAWVRWGTLSVVVVMLTHLVIPTSATYVSQRFVVIPWFAAITGQDVTENGALRGAKWILAMAVFPMLVTEGSKLKPELVRRITNAWMLGATLSALAAVTDLLGLTTINGSLMILGAETGRQSGLTSHPNHLGMSVAMAAPLAIGFAMRSRWKGVALTLILMAGALVSGSRAGQAGFVVAVTATLALSSRARRFAPFMIVAVGIIIASIVWTKPNLVETAGSLFRFDTADKYVAQSNEERNNLNRQAAADFAARPFDGVGFEVLAQAHNIYLQVLAAGGLVLAVGVVVYFGGMLQAGLAERHSTDPIGLYLLVAACVWLAAGTFGNELTDRYLYVPVAGLAALQYHAVQARKKRRGEFRKTVARRRAALREQSMAS